VAGTAPDLEIPAAAVIPQWLAQPPRFISIPLWLAQPPRFASVPLCLALPPRFVLVPLWLAQPPRFRYGWLLRLFLHVKKIDFAALRAWPKPQGVVFFEHVQCMEALHGGKVQRPIQVWTPSIGAWFRQTVVCSRQNAHASRFRQYPAAGCVIPTCCNDQAYQHTFRAREPARTTTVSIGESNIAKKIYRSAVITDYLDSAMTGSAAADHLDSAIAGPAAADRLDSAIAGSAAADSMQRKGLKRKKSGLRVRITTCMNFSARMPCFPTDGRIS
jgi:hypothetical protein